VGRSSTSTRGRLPVPEIRADDPALTRFAGAIPLVAFMTQELRLIPALRDVVRHRGRQRLYAPHLLLFSFVVGVLVGVERMAHLEWLRDDAVLLKWLRLPSWPVRKVFSKALANLTEAGRARLEALVGELGVATLPAGTNSVVVDIDPTALVDYGTAEGSKFGYCGKGRRRRRHYPIVASLAETRAVLAAVYRGGDQLNSAELVAFFQRARDRIVDTLGSGVTVFFRGDSGMGVKPVVNWLMEQGHSFAFALAMRPQIKSMLVQAQWSVDPDDEMIEFTKVAGRVCGLPDGTWVIGIRRRDDDDENPAQGKLLPGCRTYRYQSLITSEDWEARDVWRFYNHRADCERVFRVGKQVLGMGHLVSRTYSANAAAFLLRLLAFNVDIRFQQKAEELAEDQGRKVHRVGLQWRQFRFYCSPGRLLREHGRWILRVPTNPSLARVWAFYRPLIGTPTNGIAM